MSGDRLSLDPRYAVKSHPFGIINRIINRIMVAGFPVPFSSFFFFSFLFVAKSKFIQNALELESICLIIAKTCISNYVFLHLFYPRKRINTYILICTFSISYKTLTCFSTCTCKGYIVLFVTYYRRRETGICWYWEKKW